MPSDVMKEKSVWSDPRSFMTMYIMPLGGLVWAAETAFMVYIPYMVYFTEKGVGVDEIRRLGVVAVAILGFLAGGYYTLGAYQIFFLELRERFIARKVIVESGVFRLKGYYFKEATFNADEVASVEPITVSERWFQKRLGTLLSRSTRFTIPHGKNVNLRITLRDGRVFYFPGEMGRPGQWKDEDVKELREFMEGIAQRNLMETAP